MRADGDVVVVVGDSGVVEGSGRPVSVAEVSSVEGWPALWGLTPSRDTVVLFVGVRPGDGEVMDPSWFDRAYLSPGDRLPDGIPVTARRNTWPMGPREVRLLTVRVPVAALRPGSHIDALAMATAAEGVVVA